MPVLTILALLVLSLGWVLLGPRVLLGLDLVYQKLALVNLGRQALSLGSLPLWNPNIFCGVPYLPTATFSFVDPLNLVWVFTPLSLERVVNLSLLTHLLVGALGFYWLCRLSELNPLSSAIGVFVFVGNGYVLQSFFAGHIGLVSVYWMSPWWWAALRRYVIRRTLGAAIWAAIALALLCMTGHSQGTWMMGVAGLLYLIGVGAQGEEASEIWHGLGEAFFVAAGIALLAAGLAAPRVLPSLEYAHLSDRSLLTHVVSSRENSLAPQNLLGLVMPPSGTENPAPSARAEGRASGAPQIYTGWVALLLILAGLLGRRRPFQMTAALLALISLALALGPALPLEGWVRRLVPTYGYFRVPGRWLYVFAFALSFLAALGMQRLFEGVSQGAGKDRARVLTRVIAVCLVMELFFHGASFVRVMEAHPYRIDPELGHFLRSYVGSGRVLWPGFNGGSFEGLQNCLGNEGLMPGPLSAYLNRIQGLPADTAQAQRQTLKKIRVQDFDLLSARLWVSDKRSPLPAPDPSLPVIFQNSRYQVWGSLGARPRAWVVHRAKVVFDDESALTQLLSKGRAYEEEVFLEWDKAPIDLPQVDSPGFSAATVVSSNPHSLIIDTVSEDPGFLVVSDTYYPGWWATLDGEPAELLCANYLMRAVYLPSGQHTVRMDYRPRSVTLGFLIAPSLWLLLGAVAFIRRRRY
ncbi:MAG: YfhO family protein [Candidatus Omnitrophica bacterium]|nr:YfhO family protein [Candidatus Omnitrophota bacterium]